MSAVLHIYTYGENSTAKLHKFNRQFGSVQSRINWQERVIVWHRINPYTRIGENPLFGEYGSSCTKRSYRFLCPIQFIVYKARQRYALPLHGPMIS